LGLLINNPVIEALSFHKAFLTDSLTCFLKALVLIGSIVSVLISFDYLKTQAFYSFEYMVLILLSTGAMMLLLSSNDFLSLFLSVELQGLAFYVLAASKRDSEFSTEAGLKYFILGAFSSGILLFGCSLIYGLSGITNFEELMKLISGGGEGPEASTLGSRLPWDKDLGGSPSFGPLPEMEFFGIILGILFVLVGFLFKLHAAPFHMWCPDVYEGAPTFITAFFSITPKIAILGIFARFFLYTCYDLLLQWQWILIFSSITSLIVSCFVAISQKKLKRLLAWSSIGHVGYLCMGLACGSQEGLQALLIYLVIYAIMTANLFACVLSLNPQRDGAQQNNWLVSSSYLYINDLHRLSKTNPLLALNFTLILFSVAGVPPLAGFCSKFYIFFASLSSSLYTLAIIGVITSVISSFYYIRLIKIMYFNKRGTHNSISYVSMDRLKSLVIGISLAFVAFFFLRPTPLFLLTQELVLLNLI
jgi:NADH:ubiquinone oxidoreductase subunit 2 (subunit N)